MASLIPGVPGWVWLLGLAITVLVLALRNRR